MLHGGITVYEPEFHALLATQEYAICDPAAAASRTTVSSAAMEAARQSFGTDEDILLVSRESYHCCGAPVQLWKEDRCRCGGSEQKRVV